MGGQRGIPRAAGSSVSQSHLVTEVSQEPHAQTRLESGSCNMGGQRGIPRAAGSCDIVTEVSLTQGGGTGVGQDATAARVR